MSHKIPLFEVGLFKGLADIYYVPNPLNISREAALVGFSYLEVHYHYTLVLYTIIRASKLAVYRVAGAETAMFTKMFTYLLPAM